MEYLTLSKHTTPIYTKQETANETENCGISFKNRFPRTKNNENNDWQKLRIKKIEHLNSMNYGMIKIAMTWGPHENHLFVYYIYPESLMKLIGFSICLSPINLFNFRVFE